MERYQQYLDQLSRTESLRTLRETETDGNYIRHNGRRMLNLSSNDYMGVGSNRELWRAFLAEAAESDLFGGGSCSSRLLTGNHPAYRSLEEKLSGWYGSEAALVFDSGYHANLGILPALTSNKDLILADKLVHASLIDGMRLATANKVRFRHNDWQQLESILEKRRSEYEQVIIVTESVFSMDGDRADLQKLVELKKRYNTLLYVDEAHAIGVLGEFGLGLGEESGVAKEIDLLVGTFGKAVASQGAFVVCSARLREYLINTMRPLIFSTALPPLSIAWTERVMEYLREQSEKRKQLGALSKRLREGFRSAGLETAGQSPIVPLIVRNNAQAVALSEHLCERGFFILPIRTPTVPAGSERLRISLTAEIPSHEIDSLIEACKTFGA